MKLKPLPLSLSLPLSIHCALSPGMEMDQFIKWQGEQDDGGVVESSNIGEMFLERQRRGMGTRGLFRIGALTEDKRLILFSQLFLGT